MNTHRPSIPNMSGAAGSRELSADLYRASALVLIVIGHWLAASVTFRDGRFGNDTVLAVLPWTQWLTWSFQAVPLFFLVAGYANAVSWTRWRVSDRAASWYRHWLAAVLGPTTVYVAVVLAAVAVLVRAGVGPQLALVAWAVALHLWFVPVYLLVVALTPVAVAAQQRWGLAVPAALALAVVIVDIAVRCADLTTAGWLNYLLCWAAVYQLGIAWHQGTLRGRRALLAAAGSASVLAALLALRLYPVSIVGVAGQRIQNTSPPTVAMLAFAVVQCALAVAAAPALSHGWLVRHYDVCLWPPTACIHPNRCGDALALV